MQDYGLFKNAEGYTDKTAGQGIYNADTPKAGEIHETDFGEVLVLKNNGNVCNCLKLIDQEFMDTIPVEASCGSYFVNPKMVMFQFNNKFLELKGNVTESVYNHVMGCVEEVLQINLAPMQEQQPAQPQRGYYLDINRADLQNLSEFVDDNLIECIRRDETIDNPCWVMSVCRALEALRELVQQEVQ